MFKYFIFIFVTSIGIARAEFSQTGSIEANGNILAVRFIDGMDKIVTIIHTYEGMSAQLFSSEKNGLSKVKEIYFHGPCDEYSISEDGKKLACYNLKKN